MLGEGGPAGLLGAHPVLPACSHSPQQRVQFSCQAEIHICILIISQPLGVNALLLERLLYPLVTAQESANLPYQHTGLNPSLLRTFTLHIKT
uniref:Uncharacterized protein n=1 Tax=Junco hyemalis TaxID=40217 RepID=A0A8C5JGH1_JUNHY